ncbi:MAG TPA: DUF763 domain-containing protein [Actinomycetota bacterium]|nr:DUF763 domain-containing protein [Actinomycetota bacterium]
MRTGYADSPLHSGRAPAWLFGRMASLAREMTLAIVAEEGSTGLLRRVADPFWFQAFGSVLGFDWHSSGITTTTCGALKEGLRGLEDEIGLYVCGGKGKTSRRTPDEITRACDKTGQDADVLVTASKLSAKVDSAAVQDGFELYHHSFLFTTSGDWAVVQQGMRDVTKSARRYHWHTAARFDSDPHAAIAGRSEQRVLNLVASEGEGNRSVSVELSREQPNKIATELKRMRTLEMPRHHEVRLADIHPDRIERVLVKSYEAQPRSFVELLSTPGVGAKGLRALALVAELTYGEPASVRDPASYSFAHGGKDGTPYPVDRLTYDATVESLHRALRDAKAGRTEKTQALKRLAKLET